MTVLTRLVCLLLACTIAVSRSYVIQPGTWKFRGHPIAYETAKSVKSDGIDSQNADPTPVLLLNGFGVGSFHQHRLIHELLGDDKYVDRPIYCIDYLGQGTLHEGFSPFFSAFTQSLKISFTGRSWPENCRDGEGECEIGLRYCGSTWVDQICSFIEEVILPQHPGMTIHLVGNSVGGHLATFVAASRPDLVKSLSLLNATPVWGLNLPGWDGQLPAPWFPKIVGRYLFDRIRDLTTIEQYLKAAYGNRNAFDTELMQQIRACTEGPGGHAAFASILWSPPVTIRRNDREVSSFYDALESVDCDVLLLFGAEDPWCKPAFAKRMLQRLEQRPSGLLSKYVEVAGVGVSGKFSCIELACCCEILTIQICSLLLQKHCPNHEAPKATALMLNEWWRAEEKKALVEGPFSIREAWGETTLQERALAEISLSLVDRLAVTFV